MNAETLQIDKPVCARTTPRLQCERVSSIFTLYTRYDIRVNHAILISLMDVGARRHATIVRFTIKVPLVVVYFRDVRARTISVITIRVRYVYTVGRFLAWTTGRFHSKLKERKNYYFILK